MNASTALRLKTRSAACLIQLAILAACGGPHPQRTVAIGDLHGDMAATRSALRLAGAIDDHDRWIGGNLVVVQTGDLLDRGDDEQELLDLFERLRIEASKAGGAFHTLLGNHEIMNARGDLRYVTDGGFADFPDSVQYGMDDPALAEFKPHERGRMAAFLPGRRYALLLAKLDVVVQVGETLFVHGGILPAHIAHGLDTINRETQAWLRGETGFPAVLEGSNSPQWSRLYSSDPDPEACAVLSEVLSAVGAKRLVMGHTVQDEGIASACAGQAWLIDVGMAAHYGGEVEVLEISGDSIRALGGIRSTPWDGR